MTQAEMRRLPRPRALTDVEGIAWDQLLYGGAIVLVPALVADRQFTPPTRRRRWRARR